MVKVSKIFVVFNNLNFIFLIFCICLLNENKHNSSIKIESPNVLIVFNHNLSMNDNKKKQNCILENISFDISQHAVYLIFALIFSHSLFFTRL